MSSLKTVEKKVFEDLFRMSGGYVLDLTNNSFAELFRETLGIDIYSDEYSFNGNSKANRLRAFWEIGQDSDVGKVLSEMLEVWEYLNPQHSAGSIDARYTKARSIVERLLDKNSEKEPASSDAIKKNSEILNKFIVELYLSRCSDAAKFLQQSFGAEAVKTLNQQIRGFIRDGLKH